MRCPLASAAIPMSAVRPLADTVCRVPVQSRTTTCRYMVLSLSLCLFLSLYIYLCVARFGMSCLCRSLWLLLNASAALALLARLACFALLALVLAALSALPRCLWFVRSICSVAGCLLCSSWLLVLRLPSFAALLFEAGFAHARSQLRRFV